jgi:hypothetical protein
VTDPATLPGDHHERREDRMSAPISSGPGPDPGPGPGPTVIAELRALAAAAVPAGAAEQTLAELAAEVSRALAAAREAAGPGRLADALETLGASATGRITERADECRVLARSLRETVVRYRDGESATARLVTGGSLISGVDGG